MTIDAHDPRWRAALVAAFASLGIDTSPEHLAGHPAAIADYRALCKATAEGGIDARILHRAWRHYTHAHWLATTGYITDPVIAVGALDPGTIADLVADRIATLSGYAQLFADDASFPEHYIAFSARGTYHLLPRIAFGDGRPIPPHLQGTPVGSWALKTDVSEDQIAGHLYPLDPKLASIIALVAHSTRQDGP